MNNTQNNDATRLSFPELLDLSGVPLKMIKVKAGQFLMGSDEDEVGRFEDEVQHWVTLSQDYWLGATAVTQGQWKAVMGNNPSQFKKGDNYPVERVTWYNAMDFCNNLNKKYSGQLPAGYKFSLPTEAQWEYACRAGTTTALNNGRNLADEEYNCPNVNEVGWYNFKNAAELPHPVAQKKGNAWGFYDMHGNVEEWCSDWYDEDYGDDYMDIIDPQGAYDGKHKVARGGSCCSYASQCRSAARDECPPSDADLTLGFRLALVPIEDDAPQVTEKPLVNASAFPALLDLSGVQLKMIKVKAGRFQMGSPDREQGRMSDEKQHWVTLTEDYWLGETPVTQGQWMAVMSDNPSHFKKGGNYPVEWISWDDAMDFCDELNHRYGRLLPPGYEFSLPTEAQWEYACRAGTTTALNNGKNLTSLLGLRDNVDEVAWYKKNSGGETCLVGQKKPNAWGFFDMHGNVWEWCRDWYNGYKGDENDPLGPVTGQLRVRRGGSFIDDADGCRAAMRCTDSSSDYCCHIGFRLALVPIKA